MNYTLSAKRSTLYEYDAYGKTTFIAKGADGLWYTGDDVISDKPNPSYANPYYLAGRDFDFLDNGKNVLCNSRIRTLGIDMGRMLQHDPTGYVDGLNLYEYVGSNPINNYDPLGLSRGDSYRFCEFFLLFNSHIFSSCFFALSAVKRLKGFGGGKRLCTSLPGIITA